MAAAQAGKLRLGFVRENAYPKLLVIDQVRAWRQRRRRRAQGLTRPVPPRAPVLRTAQADPLSKILADICGHWGIEDVSKHAFKDDNTGRYVTEEVHVFVVCWATLFLVSHVLCAFVVFVVSHACVTLYAEPLGAEGRVCDAAGSCSGEDNPAGALVGLSCARLWRLLALPSRACSVRLIALPPSCFPGAYLSISLVAVPDILLPSCLLRRLSRGSSTPTVLSPQPLSGGAMLLPSRLLPE